MFEVEVPQVSLKAREFLVISDTQAESKPPYLIPRLNLNHKAHKGAQKSFLDLDRGEKRVKSCNKLRLEKTMDFNTKRKDFKFTIITSIQKHLVHVLARKVIGQPRNFKIYKIHSPYSITKKKAGNLGVGNGHCR